MVMTTKSRYASVEEERRDLMPDAISSRKWGKIGRLCGYSNSHGLIFDIQHQDLTIGSYNPEELILVDPETPMELRDERSPLFSILETDIRAIRDDYAREFMLAKTEGQLLLTRTDLTNELAALLKDLVQLPADERKICGNSINMLNADMNKLYQNCLIELQAKNSNKNDNPNTVIVTGPIVPCKECCCKTQQTIQADKPEESCEEIHNRLKSWLDKIKDDLKKKTGFGLIKFGK